MMRDVSLLVCVDDKHCVKASCSVAAAERRRQSGGLWQEYL